MKESYKFDVDEIIVIDFNGNGWNGYYGERDKDEKQHTSEVE